MILVTGGWGFIGSAFIRRNTRRDLINVDARTYAADPARLGDCPDVKTFTLDITENAMTELVKDLRPDGVIHFAAQSHVTRSESDPEVFYRTNVDGTRNIFEAARETNVRFVVHVSTDEVYGPIERGRFREEDKEPGFGSATSPYARSKALADDIALEYQEAMRVIVVRPTNCFGPWQHVEKAIPRWITRALRGHRIPVWGDGGQVREWIFVDDLCAAIELLIEQPDAAGLFNISPGGTSFTNLDVARMIAHLVHEKTDSVYLTAYDRPQHDYRYALDSSRLRQRGWQPEWDLEKGLARTIEWYRAHEHWWHPLIPAAEEIYTDDLPAP